MASGQRLEGLRLDSWHEVEHGPRLDGRRLDDPANHYRWIRNRSLQVSPRQGDRIELVGGDVVPGVVLAYVNAGIHSGLAVPAHFVVRTSESLTNSASHRSDGTLRINARFVQAIVRHQGLGILRQLAPNTALLADGQCIPFRKAKLSPDGVLLLADAAVRKLSWSGISEFRLPPLDAWASYYEHLALADPNLAGRIERIETTGGTVLMYSSRRFRAAGAGKEEGIHLFQPAWSLDLIAIETGRIVRRSSFAPTEVPLTHLHPVRTVHRNTFAKAGVWKTNASIHGDLLVCKGRQYTWGFGTRAYSELHFVLPAAARAFSTQFALDESVGSGGCVRGRIFLNHVDSRPLYVPATFRSEP